MADNVVTAAQLHERLVANPFNNWMGLKVLGLDEEKLEVGLTWREEMVSNPKARYTHGGIIGALIDVAADFAIAAKLGQPVPTVDMRVDYHRAAMPGDLRAVGRVIRMGGTFSVAEAMVYDGENRLIASGRGVYFTQPPKA
ncbi:MAG: PaaI family thioesterase [Alphaproteobacteria bacterium]|nr:PaaI family thioesterase [Alphaproteobacteria bacterium]